MLAIFGMNFSPLKGYKSSDLQISMILWVLECNSLEIILYIQTLWNTDK